MSHRTTQYCATCLTTFFDNPTACTNLTCGESRPAPGWGVLLRPGDLLDRHYAVERVLAVGGAGLTYLAREVDGNGEPKGPQVAIKVLYTARDTGPFLRRLANEARILQELAHDHIVQCLGFVQRVGQEPYLVTLFEEGGSLRQHIERVGPLPPVVAAGIIRQVLLALDVAHQRAVVHRDLKPDNVLLRQAVDVDELPHIRVADFGIAKVRGGLTDRLTKLGSFVGTPEYAAPEQFEGLQPTPAADLFATGGLLWFLLTAQPPVTFTARHDLASSYEELLDQVPPQLRGAPHHIKNPADLDLLQEALDQLMHHSAERRWTVHQVLQHLQPLCGGDLKVSKSLSTLEFTDGGAPHRNATPTFTLGPDEAPPEHTDPPMPAVPSAPGSRDPTDAPAPPRAALPSDHTEEEATTAPEMVQEADTAVPVAPSASNTLEPSDHTPAPLPPRPAAQPSQAPQPPEESASETRWVQAPLAATVERAVPAAPVAPAPTAGGGVGRAVGCFGLSFMGVAVSGGGGLAGVVVVLLGAAWGFGWFASPELADLSPVALQKQAPSDWGKAPHMLGRHDKAASKRLEIQEALTDRAKGIGKTCSAKGPILADLLIEPGGGIAYASVDPEGLTSKEQACVQRELGRLKLSVRAPRQARVRVAVPLSR